MSRPPASETLRLTDTKAYMHQHISTVDSAMVDVTLLLRPRSSTKRTSQRHTHHEEHHQCCPLEMSTVPFQSWDIPPNLKCHTNHAVNTVGSLPWSERATECNWSKMKCHRLRLPQPKRWLHSEQLHSFHTNPQTQHAKGKKNTAQTDPIAHDRRQAFLSGQFFGSPSLFQSFPKNLKKNGARGRSVG